LSRRTIRIAAIIVAGVAGIAIALALFFVAVIAEISIRSRYGGAMTVHGLPINNVSVTGSWIPDFLWSGKAWHLKIQTDDDLELSLDDKIYIIPKGAHVVYSNHDHTNTGQFGEQDFWGYPEKVEVRLLNGPPSP